MKRNDNLQSAAILGSGRNARRGAWRNILLVTGREFKNQISQKGYKIGTAILILLVVIASFMPTIIKLATTGGAQRTRAQIVVVNDAGQVGGMAQASLIDYIAGALNGDSQSAAYEVRSGASGDLEALYEQVDSGGIDVLFQLSRRDDDVLHMVYCTAASPMSDGNYSMIHNVAEKLDFLDEAHRMQLSRSQIDRLQAPAGISIEYRLSGAKPANEFAAGYIFSFGAGIIMYISILIYGNSVATGVVVEKSSRVMELLVKSAAPFQLLAGKIAGIGAACLMQMGFLAVAGIGSLLLQTPLQTALFGAQTAGFVQHLAGVSVRFFLFFLWYFLLYFFMYASLYAGLGAMVRRQDELQSIILIPTFMIIFGFFAIYLGAFYPDAQWVKVLSYIPLFTPMLMMVRIGLSEVIWWEYILTTALMLAAIYAGTVLSARLYRRGVLMYGQKPTFGQMIKMAGNKEP